MNEEAQSILDTIIASSPHLSWMRDGILFITRHGSTAYNTNIASSDKDYKGICVPTKQYLFGFQHKFEQAELKKPDTVIFEVRKFFNLAAACNPNCLEVIYTAPSDHCLVSSIGEVILEHRDMFLSKRVKHTMCGYAMQQMHRIKQHRRWILTPAKNPPTRDEMGLPEQTLIPKDQYMAADADIKKELEKHQFNFLEDCSEPTKIVIQNAWREMLIELKITTSDQWLSAARKIGLNDNFIEIMQKERQYRNAQDEWKKFLNWKATRNPERYALEEKYGYDSKHGYHLVRLLRMCREILTTGKVNVKRNDREELLEIRNGSWSFDKLMAFAEAEDNDLQTVYETTNILPKIPDFKRLDALCINIVEAML